MDFENMSNEELRQLASAVEKEMAIRRQYKQEQLWGEVREAIRNIVKSSVALLSTSNILTRYI